MIQSLIFNISIARKSELVSKAIELYHPRNYKFLLFVQNDT